MFQETLFVEQCLAIPGYSWHSMICCTNNITTHSMLMSVICLYCPCWCAKNSCLHYLYSCLVAVKCIATLHCCPQLLTAVLCSSQVQIKWCRSIATDVTQIALPWVDSWHSRTRSTCCVSNLQVIIIIIPGVSCQLLNEYAHELMHVICKVKHTNLMYASVYLHNTLLQNLPGKVSALCESQNIMQLKCYLLNTQLQVPGGSWFPKMCIVHFPCMHLPC